MMDKPRRVVLQWPRFGPYHVVRINAFARLAAYEGIQTVALETASEEQTYERLTRGAAPETGTETLFKSRAFEDLSPRAIRDAVFEALDRHNPDAVAINSYSLPDARASLAWCRRRRRIAVLMTDSKRDDAPRQYLRERLKSVIIRQFDAALVGGEPHRRYVSELGMDPGRIFTGCDAVDNAFFARAVALRPATPPTSLPGLDDARPFFLASARFIHRKNLIGLIDAFSEYRRSATSPWRLVILGDGSERPMIASRIGERGLQGDVCLPGFRSMEDTLFYYARAGAFVHPARADQWGLVVNEAMAAGLPVIVSIQSGCAEDLVVNGENGFRFDATEEGALTDLLGRISGPDVDRVTMGRRSQAIIADWGPDRFARELLRSIEAGRETSARRPGLEGRLVLSLLDRFARSVRSFHTVEA